ncbi:MAG TPA: hypothetical protein VJ749_04400 [Pyrinomonadaceae bacterium]|nr:hypothetical protein [Pyrinomonadaceae bacterium]
MPKDNENIRLPVLGPLATPSEPQGFAPEQMIRCEECLRANPPTRINCLYCSVPLPVTESSARLRTPVLRRPEKHELGYNTIVLPRSHVISREAIEDAASLLRLKQEDLERVLTEGVTLPLARTASREEAELIAERLQAAGFRVVTLKDEDAVVRVRSLSFDGSTFVVNPGQITNEVDVSWSNVVLLVTGRIVEKRVEVKEVKSRGAENEILDTSELFSDEAVIDLYASAYAETWRISANGFDFSCLGAKKTLLATENITTLQRVLIANATNARLDDSYNRLRPLLDLVWGPEQETQSSGWRRERPGKLSLGMTTIHNNESQFTRYSRLLFHLATHSLD